jgi:hypothetical protein
VITLNPGLLRQGAKVGVSGVGFDTRAFVDLQFTVEGAESSSPIGSAPVGRGGQFNAEFTVPPMPGVQRAVVTAQQRGSSKIARSDAVVPGGVASAQIGKETGAPGDQVDVSGGGFTPGEKVNVHWGSIDGPPVSRITADKSGGFARAPLRVGVAPTGPTTLLLIGDKSRATATAPFLMQGLYPTMKVQPYSLRAAERLGFSAEGFAPGEPVLVYINSSSGQPVLTLPAGEGGKVPDTGFMVPFELVGAQNLTLVGEQSRASAGSGFDVQAYTPSAQPSTYGGMPGTAMSFYANGFAPNEVVQIFTGRGANKPGELLSAFRVDDEGNAGAAGSYQIPAGAGGQVSLQLVGRQSKAVANTTVSVQNAGGNVKIPPTPKYELPPELQADPLVPGGPPPPVPEPPAQSAPTTEGEAGSTAPTPDPSSTAPTPAPGNTAPAPAPGGAAPAPAPGGPPNAPPANPPR